MANKFKSIARNFTFAQEVLSLPDEAGSISTDTFNLLDALDKDPNAKVSLNVKASAVSGTNIDIALVGVVVDALGNETDVVIQDAIVADITDSTLAVAQFQPITKPYSKYKIQATVDADESANTLTVGFGYVT